MLWEICGARRSQAVLYHHAMKQRIGRGEKMSRPSVGLSERCALLGANFGFSSITTDQPTKKGRLFLAKAAFFLIPGRGEKMERQLRCLAFDVCQPATPVSVRTSGPCLPKAFRRLQVVVINRHTGDARGH